jgi:AraC-like DNA-binding protein
MENKSKIRIHRSKFKGLNIHIKKVQSTNSCEWIKYAHRDEHFIFYVQQEGLTELMIDFKNYQMNGKTFLFICPGQVHYYIRQTSPIGYFIFIDSSFLRNEYRSTFENHQNINQVNPILNDSLFELISLIADRVSITTTDIGENIIHSLTDSLMGIMVLEIKSGEKQHQGAIDRKTELLSQFRNLVRKHFEKFKKPKNYADILNISVPYLNEIIKQQTGYTVSYWIQQEILLEAKRLLHYTQLSSKEIAFAVGYDDYAYFSRFFKKNVGITPLEFRKNYFDLSNLYY